MRNINDGISLLNISEGALRELSNIATRQKELAAQAANGVYSLTQRRALNSEANALVDEWNRVVESTSFNGQKLLDGSLRELRIQAGFGTTDSLALGVGSELDRTVGTGTFSASYQFNLNHNSITAADVNGDGKLDMVAGPRFDTGTYVYIGNGDGTFNAARSYQAGLSLDSLYNAALTKDLNGDGKIDLTVVDSSDATVSVLLGNGDGTFQARRSFSATGTGATRGVLEDFNGDGKADLLAGNSILFGNGDGTFRASVLRFGTNAGYSAGDLNGDGIVDLVGQVFTNATYVHLGNGDGTFRTRILTDLAPTDSRVLDFNQDGYDDIVTSNYNSSTGNTVSIFLNNGDGSFKARTSYVTGTGPLVLETGDFNGDGLADVVTSALSGPAMTLLGNGDGTLRAARSATGSMVAPYGIDTGDFNGDGVTDLAFADAAQVMQMFIGNTTTVTSIARVNLLTQSSARSTLDTLEQALNRVSSELGSIGALQSRLGVAFNTIESRHENYKAAESRIIDVDVAQETAEMIRTQILQQAGSAVLAQANQQPALALQLL